MRLDFNPNIWGPNAWFFIESSILSYPDNPNNIEIENYKIFFNSLQYILPCSKCRHNYSIHIKKYPLTNKILSNKDNLLEWIIKIHNLASNKKNNIYDTLNYYKKSYNNNNNNNNKFIISFFVIIVSLIILFYYYKLYE